MPTDKTLLTPIFSSPKKVNDDADEVLVKSLESMFPIENKNYVIQVSNIHTERKNYSKVEEKDAILRSKSMTYPIKGDLSMFSKATGKLIDQEKNFSLMDAFHITDKHTIMYKGSAYSIANQLQLLPGVYTRTRENTNELEAHVNTSKGASFRIVLDPQSKIFFLEVGSTHTPMGPLLKEVYGISETEAVKYIPKDVWQANQTFTAGKEDKIIRGLYSRMVYTKNPASSVSDMVVALRQALEASTLSPETTKVTLGKPFTGVSKEAILSTIRNLVQVHTREKQEDNRDSLQFKRVQNLPDYLATRFFKDHDSVRRVKNKMGFGMERIDPNNPKISQAIPIKPFSKVYSSYIQQSSLIATPQETNPLESLENIGKVTSLGPEEGGISSERGVPMGARNIDPSHLGIIDPARTPESSHAGIDQRFAINAHRDKHGTLYTPVLDNDGKTKYLSVSEMMSTVIGFSDKRTTTDKIVEAQDHGEMRSVLRTRVEYWIPHASNIYTVTTNLIPFLNSNHPGRLTMAGKAIPQALSLVNREEPLVQTVDSRGVSFTKRFGGLTATSSEANGGVVVRVDEHEIHIKDPQTGEIHKVKAIKNLPFNMKGFQDDEKPLVSKGDTVVPYQVLYDNNYTKNGVLALGRNLTVAYMPYKGYNHEDGMVISETAAKGMDSHHSYKVDYEVNPNTVSRKILLKRYFPGKFTPDQLNKLDDSGYAKPGVDMTYGDPVYAVLEKREATPEDKILGRLHKSLVNPYRLVTEPWNHPEIGKVVDAHTTSKNVRFFIRSVKPLEVGDKLTGLHGNKGIISLILPDDEMPTNKATNKAVDLVLNPASVTSRINLGQLMETAAAKVAQKTGKPYLVDNFSNNSNVTAVKTELSKHGLSDTDEIIDPKTGHSFGQIFGGPQYFLKLYKTSDQNLSARNVGGYDNVHQPIKGGEEGSKSVGWMENLGLLGSDARKNLKEIGTVKSEQNDEYWAKFIRGEALPKPKQTFATKKFFDTMKGAGVNVRVEDGNITASPMTDKEILLLSNGALKEPLMLNAKNLAPEESGLYDQAITGGLKGEKWSHYHLAEPLVNPAFEGPVKSILGLSTGEFDNITSGKFGVHDHGDKTFSLVDNLNNGKLVRKIKI
jgi:DNA-directed RNA polymerase beta subunit